MLRLVWSPANQCFISMFGDALCSIGERTFFADRGEAARVCAEHQLVLGDDNRITSVA